jgi:hypothetical protein
VFNYKDESKMIPSGKKRDIVMDDHESSREKHAATVDDLVAAPKQSAPVLTDLWSNRSAPVASKKGK